MSIEEFLGSSFFRYGVFPLLSATGGILIKCATRNDQYAFFKKEDMAVGPQLVFTSILTYIVITSDRARNLIDVNRNLSAALTQKPIDPVKVSALQSNAYNLSQSMLSAVWTILILSICLWAVTTWVKRKGWVNESELEPRLGIGFPLVSGVASLIYVMVAAS